MKNVLINSGLVVALLGIFAVPMFGFSFIKYEKPNTPMVLGDTDVKLNKNTSDGINVVEQIDVNLHLSKDTSQIFYNIVPKEYLYSNYKFLVVLPNKVKLTGVEAVIVKDSNGVNLKLYVAPDFDISKELPVSILVVE